MADEIERKYLVRKDTWRAEVTSTHHLDQAYLASDPDCTVRVRIADDQAYLTLKGRKTGASAPEYEYAIPLEEARDMMARLPNRGRVRKHRHHVRHAGLLWEVDEFFDANEGLIMAEVELEREDQDVPLPDWAGEEVTADRRYANSSLAAQPFREWEKD